MTTKGKESPKTSRKKRAPSTGAKAAAKTAGNPAEAEDDRAAARRVAMMKNKLTTAMEDPLTRSQIVAAIRTMMKEGR